MPSVFTSLYITSAVAVPPAGMSTASEPSKSARTPPKIVFELRGRSGRLARVGLSSGGVVVGRRRTSPSRGISVDAAAVKDDRQDHGGSPLREGSHHLPCIR